jgi:FecR protein.
MKKQVVLVAATAAALLCLCGATGETSAQDGASKAKAKSSAYAEIVFYDGADIVVLKADGMVSSGDPMGQKLQSGDQVQTGAKTSVELVLMPRQSRIRLSENTAVTIRDLGDDGATGLDLVYGRLRSKVAKLAGGSAPYKVSSQSCVAGVRGTDFGCDVLVAKSGGLAPTRVYCFEGSVEVAPLSVITEAAPSGAAPAEQAKAEAIVITAGGMALVEAASQGKAVSVVQKPIDAEVSNFWKANDFTESQPVALARAADFGASSSAAEAAAKSEAAKPLVAAPEALPAAPPAAPQVDWRTVRSRLAVKNAGVIGAAAFIAFGSAFELASLAIRSSDSTRADELLYAGVIFDLTALPILISTLFVDPVKGVAP